MKKNVFFLCLALVIITSLVLVGCSSTPSSTPPPSTTQAAPPASTSAAPKTTSAPPTTSAPAPSTSSAPAANVITLKYSDQNPADGWDGKQADIPYLNAITKATNGRVQFQTYFSQALNKGPDTWTAVQNGTADMGWMVHGYWANLTPLADVIALPFLGITSAKQASSVIWQLYDKFPALSSEFKDNHVLVLWGSQPFFLATSKKQVQTLADWQGLKIRTLAGPAVDTAKALGAIPLTIAMPDLYLSLQKGVVDGALVPWEAVISFKLYEVLKYYSNIGTCVSYFSVAMNNNTWNKLPPDVQQQINSVSGLQGSMTYGYNMFDTAVAAGPDMAKQSGSPFVQYTVPQSELDKMSAVAGKPIWDAWVQKMTAAGHPEAKDLLNAEMDLIKNYKP